MADNFCIMIDCLATCDACTLLDAGNRWRIQLHTIDESLERLRPEWDRLLAESDSNTVFSTSAWQALWWKHFGHDYVLRVITVRDGMGRLVAIAPLMAPKSDPNSSLGFIGGSEVADYLDMIVATNVPEDLRVVLFTTIKDHLQWRLLELHCVRQESPTLESLRTAFVNTEISVDVQIEDVSPYVLLPGSWEGYLAALKKKDRHELRRKIRRAVDDQGAGWHMVQSEAELDRAMDAFITLHRASSPTKAAFMTAEMEQYFRELAREAFSRSWLRLGVLWVGETPVSAAMGFSYGDRLYLYNSGYEPAYAAHSVGIAAVGLLLKDSAQEGLAAFDFLQGNEPYKYTLGASDATVYQAKASRQIVA